MFWCQTFRSYGIVMRGRSRGLQERIIVLAHQIEAMARQTKLKPLAKYLKPAKSKKKAGDDNSAVIAMFEELAAKGGNVKVRRVQRSVRNPTGPSV